MEAYTAFADVYNDFMDNIPYDEWCSNITGILADNNISSGTIADLGCGTGSMTRRLAARGYDMIGIDLSEDMLVNARADSEPDSVSDKDADTDTDMTSADILYLLQDIRKLELYGTVQAFVSVCDSMNYMLSTDDLVSVFKGVAKYLDKAGIFIFDMKTQYFYRGVLGDSVITDNREEAALIWENEYDETTSMNTYYLTIFMPITDDDNPLFERYQEKHTQRAYTIAEVTQAARSSGLSITTILDSSTMKPITNLDSDVIEHVHKQEQLPERLQEHLPERLYFIAHRQ